MPKAAMTDEQLQTLMGKLRDWLRESDEQAAKQVSMRKGGKVKIPAKPVSASGKKTVPTKLNWGKGVTKDKLAYINSGEEAALKKRRGDLPVRKVNGIPSYAEETVGPGGSGNKGGSGGTGGGTSGSAAGAGSSGGSSAPSNSGANAKTDDKKSSGPSRGPTDAPAAVGPSKSTTTSAPAGSSFGPRSSTSGASAKDPTQSASSQASKMAADSAMKTVAAGSIANPSTGSAPKSINDRVPSADQAAAARAAMSQSSKMSGAGNYSSLSNPMAGGNSPLGDTTVGSYDRAAQDSLNRSVAAAAPGLVGPSVPAGTAGFTKAQQDARFPGSPSYGSDPLDKAMSIAKAATTPIGANANLYSSPVGPSAAQKLAAEAQRNVFSGSENVTTASKVGKQFDDRVPEDQSFVQGTTVGMSPVTAAATLAPGVGPKMRNDSFRTAPQSPGNYGSYREAQAEKAFADSIGENIYGGTPVASASTPAAQPDRTVGFSNLANPNITPTDVRNTFANPDASWSAARNYGQISAPPAGSAAPGLASAQPYNDIMAAVDTAGRQPVASGVAPASVSTPVTSPAQEVADAYPSKPRGPSHKWGEKLERPFERVLGQPEGPSQDDSYLNKVDSFLSRTFGSTAADDSAYARLASNDDRGSNFEQPRPYVDNRSGAIAPMAAKTVIPKVVLPPLPPYVNYQNIPGVSSPAVALPPASQRILDYINGGYASGGLVGRQSRAFGGGMLDGFKMGGGRGQGMSAPAAAPAQAAAPQATTGGAWNLTAVGASDEPEKKTPPTGAYGQRVPDYASMSSKDVLQGWLQDQMKGLDGNSRQIVNYMDLFARLDAGGGGYGGGGGGGDGGGDGNNDDTNNVLGLTGPGTPGAWSGAKTGWRRGGGVNNSIASALRLARGMRS